MVKKSLRLCAALLMVTLAGMPYTTAASAASAPVGAEQEQLVQGTVRDASGQPVIGAYIIQVSNSTNGTITDIDGKYSIAVGSGDQIKVTCIGYADQILTVTSSTMDIVLQEDTTQLDEVVVIGYGTAKKSSLTGALSQVSSKSFEDQKVTRVDQALQGRASGVAVTNTVGAPGGNVRIRIRGANSILGDNSPLFVVDGFVGADFNTINPNDIKSMEVLKDASSTAIYGSRGANGVVLITTKSGNSNGKVNVVYDGNVSVSKIIKNYDLLSAGQFAEQVNARDEALGQNLTFTQSEIDSYYKNGGFDYVGAVLRTAVSNQHQLSVSGGNNRTSYRVSGNYLDQQGIIRESGYTRYSLRANLRTKVNDKLSFRFDIDGSLGTGMNNGNTTGASTILNQALAWAPTTNPYNEDGTYLTSDPVGSIKTNPLALLYDTERKTETSALTAIGGASYVNIPGLVADFQAAGNFITTVNSNWTGSQAGNGNASASVGSGRSKTIQTTAQLSYNKEFNGHEINAVAAVETQSYDYRYLYGTASGLSFPDLKYDNLSQATSNSTSTNYSMWSLLSYIGRVNYSYRGKYLASLSVRRDGSSKFAEGNKFSTFPAAAVAWNAGNENFIKNLGVFDKLKIRASWGFTGSQAISPYATMSTYNNVKYSFNTGSYTSGILAGNPANHDLKWETTEQKDLGLELAVLDNRLSMEIDWYIKDTRDLLLNKQVANYQGGGTIASNIGSVRNSGIDFSITGRIIEKKDISLATTLNFSYLKNKVTDLGDETAYYIESGITGITDGAYDSVYTVGESLGSIWGLNYLGPWQSSEAAEAAKYGCVPGDARYEDLNNDGVIDGSDYKIIGCGMPKYTLGWNTNFSWKKFSVNLFFQGVFGQDKLNYNNCIFTMASRDVRAATFAKALDRYIPGENEDGYLPAWNSTSLWKPGSTLFLEKASYLRLKNISFAYDFSIPRVADFTVSLNATNLFTITGYSGIDPESSNAGSGTSDLVQNIDYGAYPNNKSVTLGLNIRF